MSNDLIIDEGFPVLNNFKPSSTKDDEMKKDPIPRCQFASYTNALTMTEHRTSFLNDCSMVFTARTKEDSDGYSSGSTYFLPCLMPPRCALEELAQQIFKAHVDSLEECEDTDDNNDSKLTNGNKKKRLLYDPERSGAEWWTLVLDTPSSSNEESTVAKKKKGGNDADVAKWAKGKNEQKVQSSIEMAALLKRSKKDYEELPDGFNLYNDTSYDGKLNAESDSNDDSDDDDDEVGMHFDADYGLEEQLPTHTLHPRAATITYLSDLGVPTIILDKRPPPPSDPEKQSLNGSIKKAWLSHPAFGKHVSFDGRLLHGAPGKYFPSVAKKSNDSTSEPQAKRLKTEGDVDIFSGSGKRVTFLVNIWLNHCPIESEPLEDDIVDKLTTPWEAPIGEDTECILKVGDPIIDEVFKWNINDIETPDKLSNSISLSKASDSEGPAGEEGVVICNREVDILFGASMKDYHDASKLAASAEGGSLPIDMEEGVFTLKVGKVASSDDDEEDD